MTWTVGSARVWKAATLESRPKAAARLDLEVSVGWASLSSRGLWGGHCTALWYYEVVHFSPRPFQLAQVLALLPALQQASPLVCHLWAAEVLEG
jgi:hypothetical protein